MSGATTIAENGNRVGTGRGQPWSSADVAAVKALREQGAGLAEIGRRLEVSGTRVRDLIRRLEGRKHKGIGSGAGQKSRHRIRGEEHIERSCLRCRKPFIADARVLFMCVPCREFARDAA